MVVVVVVLGIVVVRIVLSHLSLVLVAILVAFPPPHRSILGLACSVPLRLPLMLSRGWPVPEAVDVPGRRVVWGWADDDDDDDDE